MVIRVRAGGREFEVPNGYYQGFQKIREQLRGFGPSFHELHVTDDMARLVITKHFGHPPNTRDELYEPLSINQVSGALGDVEITLGQKYETSYDGLIQAILYHGAGIEITDERQSLRVTHVAG